jgi:hypothetical protein
VLVTNTPKVSTTSTAEVTVALILAPFLLSVPAFFQLIFNSRG